MNPNFTANRLLILVMAVLFFPKNGRAASDSATVYISAKVNAVCTMETPQVVALPNIPMAAFDGLPQGAQISGYDATFSIISSCIGTTSHRYRFTTQNRVANGCSGTDDSTLQFCLYNGDTKLDLATQTAVISTTETNTDIKVTLQRDVNPPQVGTHSVFVTVTIEPE